MKRLVKLAAIAAVVVAAISALKRRPAPPSASPSAPPARPGPVEAPAVPTEVTEAVEAPETAAAPVAAAEVPWVEPTDDGGCPDGYPVKAKTSSKIFHVPGGVLYDKATPDRCYASPEAAQADGFRASMR